VIPKDAPRYLRNLEIVFEQFECIGHLKWCESGSLELLDWQRTITAIKPHLAQSSHLAIKMIFPPDMGRMYGRPYDFREEDYTFSPEEFQHRKKCYFNTVLPLARLRGHLKHLIIWIAGDMDEPGTEGTEGRQDTEYSEKWSRELTSRVMGAAYKLPTSDDYEASGQPEPLFMGTGYWLVDTDFCG
jgi:hypothetical protein